MNILVIEGSPHKMGSSNLLAEHFIRGAEEAGHNISVFDAAHANIGACQGCDYCGMNGPCCLKDDMDELRDKLLKTDMAVFVTPLYYFGFSAQIKAVIDRFYSFTGRLSGKHIKTALIAAAWNNDSWTMKDLKAHYETLCKYMHFKDQGQILGTGCGTPSMTAHTVFPKMAYELGRKL